MEKFGVGIVLYNPEIKRLSQNVDTLIQQCKNVLLLDNGSSNIAAVESLYGDNQFVTIKKLATNEGIARALNEIIKYFVADNTDWVLTMDQDSMPPENMLSEYQKYTGLSDVSLISPVIWDLSENENDPERTDKEMDEIENPITSGSLIKVEDWKLIGGFDDQMFIDLVDFDYCRRLLINHKKIIRVNSVVLRQEIGHSKQVFIFGRRIPVDNHSAFRKYYQARNSIYYYKKYKKLSDRIVLWDEMKLVIKTILFEDNKGSKLKSIFKGIKDGMSMPVEADWKVKNH